MDVKKKASAEDIFASDLKAATGGDKEAIYRTAFAFHHGMGCDVDEKKAMEWYKKGSDLGHSRCTFDMGALLLMKDLEKNGKTAWELLLKAANSGLADAQHEVGTLLSEGMGDIVKQDQTKAKEWLKKAADQGHQRATEALEEL